MRVLHTVASLDPASGGPARSVPQLLIALKEEGLDVALWVASRVLPEWSRALTELGIPVICVESPDLKGVSLIHDHGVWLPSNHRVANWARDAGIPRIVSPRGMLEPWAMAHRKWKKRLAWWLYQRRDLLDAAALHATAESEASQFRKLVLKMPVIVSPNGVAIPNNVSRVEGRESRERKETGLGIQNEEVGRGLKPEGGYLIPEKRDEEGKVEEDYGLRIRDDEGSGGGDLKLEAKRSELLRKPQLSGAQRAPLLPRGSGVKPEDRIPNPKSLKTALFLGRIHPKKGLPMLVEAWSRVRPEGWRMRVVGPDEADHRSEIASMVQAAGMEDVWSLEDAVSDEEKWHLYRESELFILPTHSENFGISVAEALASGLPVITTTGAPWRGLVEHQCGWWVDPSVDDLERALQEATSNRSVSLKSMGERGREWVARDFSWKGIAQSMLKGYKNLIINQSHERRP